MNDDELGEVTEEERQAAEQLARALDTRREAAPGSLEAVAAQVRASAGKGAPLGDDARARAVQHAVSTASSRRARRRFVPPAWAFAAAACALLAVGAPLAWSVGSAPRELEPAAYGGPTTDVFTAPFPVLQPASERAGRIARARTRDYFEALRGGTP